MEWMFMPLKRYAEFSGRSRRKEYWMWTLFQVLLYLAVIILVMITGGGAVMATDPTAAAAAGGVAMIIMALYGLVWLAFIIPGIAVTVRRLHDTNRTGWWILAPLAGYLVAFIGGLMVASSPQNPGFGAILAMVGSLVALGLAITLLVFMLLDGTRGPNKYGPDPKGGAPDEVFA